jgi:hypothetical protein
MHASHHPPVWTPVREYPAEPTGNVTARTARRIATLERNSPRLVKLAERADVDITFLGTAPLFAEPRAYSGRISDWIIGPAGRGDTIIPAAEKERLQKLVHAGIDFPLLYFAHEIPNGLIVMPGETTSQARPQPVTLDQQTAAQAIGSVPAPAGTSALAERLAISSQRLLDALRAAAPIAGSIVAAPLVIAAAPFALAGAALAAGLDPIVFGVIPAGAPVPGQPAAWYVLAQWAWPGTPDGASSDRRQTAH